MVKEKTNGQKKKNNNLKLLFCVAYFFSYLARQNYPAVLTAIIDDMNISKSLAGIAVTSSFVSYGIFQIISGFIGDKFKSEKIIFIGLFGSASINLLVFAFPYIKLMNVLWCINGIFQSLIWPPLIRLIVDNLSEDEYSETVVRASQGSYFASVLIYLVSPFIISAFSWRAVFAFSGCIVMAFSFYWLFATKNVVSANKTEKKEEPEEKQKTNGSFLFAVGIVPILISTFIAGFLRDGISVWMPTLINDVYNVGNFSAILTGAVIPVCCALFLNVFQKIGDKIGNELKSAALFYSIALVFGAIFLLTFSIYPILDVVLMSAITVCIHGVNLMLVCTVPKRFSKYGRSSTMSGIFNASVYGGSSVSTYFIARLSMSFGWRNVCAFWCVLIILASILCFSKYKKYGKII